MKKEILITIFMFLIPVCVKAGEIEKVSLPVEVKQEMKVSVDPLIEGLQWNRWTSENFVVCSINNTQAQYLHEHLELVKGWVFSRWGLYDIDFTSECRIIAVDDPELYEKLFDLKESKVDIRRGLKGEVGISVIFLLLDKPPSLTVPIPLTEVCMAEFQERYDTKFGLWSHRGMSLLNGSLSQIKEEILSMTTLLEENKPLYFSESLLSMTREDYDKETPERRRLYDRSAMMFCLLIRKEFGQNKFHWMLKDTENGNNGEDALKKQLGFRDYDHFDKTFKRYMVDLVKEISDEKIPDEYLQITEF